MNLIIGVDCDGTQNDLHYDNINIGKKYFKEVKNYSAYELKDIYGQKYTPNFMVKGLMYMEDYAKNTEPREGLVEVLNTLNDEGARFHEITARKFVTHPVFGHHYRKHIYDWNKKMGIDVFKTYAFCDEKETLSEKLKHCLKLKVDVMIDDKADVCYHLAENGIKVLMVDAIYNREVFHKNIIRVKSWKEIEINLRRIDLELQKEKIKEKTTNYIIDPIDMVEKKKKLDMVSKVFSPYIKHFVNPTILGRENIPENDGFIIVSNHLNNYDQYLIGYAIKNKHCYGLAKTSMENTARGLLFRFTGIGIFMDVNDVVDVKNKLNAIVNYVNIYGQNVLIFPEGTRKNKDDYGRSQEILEFQPGALMACKMANAQILPIGRNIEENKLVIGKPLCISQKDNIKEKAKELEKIVYELAYGKQYIEEEVTRTRK